MQVFKKVQRDKRTSNVILSNIMTLTTYELEHFDMAVNYFQPLCSILFI